MHFNELNLNEHLLRAVEELGYESCTFIQEKAIPLVLDGHDLIGQSQTGTGKTAAFGLPLLNKLETLEKRQPQILIITPTRELTMQVTQEMRKFAKDLEDVRIVSIFGGEPITSQIRDLKGGADVIVGTPGRLIDHMERHTLKFGQLKALVIDEADEMLRMGFIDDVETIIRKSPEERQVALFSATMPGAIKPLAQKYLKSPVEIQIEAKTRTAENIRQRCWQVSGLHKLDALTRILEVEPFDGMIIFARTKLATDELAQKLQARGFSAAAINGDINQAQRERTIDQLKDGRIDILVATDVAARGLDVDRISHVVNYDVPYDTESYVHRIGRTGRAGRSGEAILFIAPRERGMLRAIERATNQPIEPMELPSVATINEVRMDKFKQQITETLASSDLTLFRKLVEDYEQALNVPAIEIAAALAKMARGDVPLLLEPPKREERPAKAFEPRERADKRSAREPRFEREDRGERPERPFREKKGRAERAPEPGKETFRIEVGYEHGGKPGNIVGAIANEAGLDAKHMGRIEIFDDYSLVDLPEGMPKEILKHLKTVWCAGQQLRITRDGTPPDTAPKGPRPPRRPDTRERADTPGKKKVKNEAFFEFRQAKKKNKFKD